MTSLEKALKPYAARLRLERTAKWTFIGLLAGACAALCIRAASYIWAMPDALALCAAVFAAAPVLFALIARLFPLNAARVAREVDSRGLEARAQTALMLKESVTPMALLQREDTLERLESEDPRTIIPIKPPRWPLIGVLACAAVFGLSFAIANPQTEALIAKAAYKAEMDKQAELVEDKARALSEEDPQTPDVRKILGDLARDIRASEETKESLLAIDDTEKKLQSLRDAAADDARKAMNANGLGELAQALDSGDMDKAREMLENLSKADGAEQLKAAAGSTSNAAASAAMQSAMDSLNSGNSSQAAQMLQSALSGQSSSCSQASSTCSSLRTAIAQTGASKQQGTAGAGQSANSGKTGAGAGASLGSSDKDAGYIGNQVKQKSNGKADPTFKLAEYEPVYDPTRLNSNGVQTNERGKQGAGEVSETDAGIGVGSADGMVPYNEIIAEYSEQAVEAAQTGELPSYAQEWVEEYFRMLSE